MPKFKTGVAASYAVHRIAYGVAGLNTETQSQILDI